MAAIVWSSVFAALGTLWGWWLRGQHDRRRGPGDLVDELPRVPDPVRWISWCDGYTLKCRACGAYAENALQLLCCPTCTFPGTRT